MCLVVFQKNFRKIFSGVWKMLQGKRQNQKNKHSTQIDTRCLTGFYGVVLRELQSDDRAVDRDLAIRRFVRSRRRSRSREAPRRSRSARRPVRDLGSQSTALVLAKSADWSLDVQTGYASPSRALALSLSLSLSLSPDFI